MALITGQQLTNYYDRFQNIDVTFTKEVIRVVHLRSKETFIRCLGYQWPCIVFSSSMSGAKAIANVQTDLIQKIREANNLVSLRFSFDQPDKTDPLAFFVAGKAAGFGEYSPDHPELNFVTIRYTQRPSDDLIALLGTLLEANINATRRKEDRIEINPETIRKLGLMSKNGTLIIDGVPRKCIIRDLSFSGAMVLMTGVAKFVINKDAKLQIEVEDSKRPILVSGKIVRFDELPDRKGIGIVGVQFHEREVSMEYKMRLNDYLNTVTVRK